MLRQQGNMGPWHSETDLLARLPTRHVSAHGREPARTQESGARNKVHYGLYTTLWSKIFQRFGNIYVTQELTDSSIVKTKK